MPVASGAGAKYSYQDHDSPLVNENPPIQNQWYTLFDEEDVRLLYCMVLASDILAAGAQLEVRWTCDGNTYYVAIVAASGVEYYIYRNLQPSTGGTGGIVSSVVPILAGWQTDKRAQSFKVEVRVVSPVLVTDSLIALAVFETLEAT